MARALLISSLLCGLLAASGQAQFVQHTSPGALAQTRKTTAENAKQSSESARWKLGKVALDPRFRLRDLGYYENVFAGADESTTVDDIRGTLGAGLAAYLNLGSKSLLSGYVTPEYSWWRDQDELRELNQNWGAGWFGFFNNLTATANFGVFEQERALSDEVDAPARIEEQRQELRLELSLTDAVELIASATTIETLHDSALGAFVPGLNLAFLDRDSETVSAEIALAVRKWRLGVGLENNQVDLLVDPEGRSNTGDSPFLTIGYRSDRIDLELVGVDRQVEFVNPDIGREDLSAGTGRLSMVLATGARLNVYGARSLALAALDTDGVVTQDRQGASLVSELGNRFQVSVLAEIGTAEFRDLDAARRRDDLEVFGFGFLWRLSDDLALRLRFRDSVWDSNLDEFDRTQQSIGIEVDLGGGLSPW